MKGVEIAAPVTGLFVDVFLQYPVCLSFVFSALIYVLYPVYYEKSDATKGWRWVRYCVAIFVLLLLVSFLLIPVLSLAPDRIIFRPTPSCSTFDSPTRYICLTLNEHHKQVFYTTNWRKCDSIDPNMANASSYYIISSWIPSFDHFVTNRSIKFHPDSSPGENKSAYDLPENYCVRAAGPIGGDKQKVAFYSINGSKHHLLDSGYINSSVLQEFHFGWYFVSNCMSGLSRWLFNCTNGYLSSHNVRLNQYTRTLLLEQRNQVPN